MKDRRRNLWVIVWGVLSFTLALLCYAQTCDAQDKETLTKDEISAIGMHQMAVKNAELQLENAKLKFGGAIKEVRANHKLEPGDDWDEQGNIVRAPKPDEKSNGKKGKKK